SAANIPEIDLQRVYLVDINLSSTELCSIDFSNLILDSVDLSDAVLRSVKFENIDFRATNWWDAKSVNGELLLYLIKNARPYFIGTSGGRGAVYEEKNPSKAREMYLARVRALCAHEGVVCPSRMPFSATD